MEETSRNRAAEIQLTSVNLDGSRFDEMLYRLHTRKISLFSLEEFSKMDVIKLKKLMSLEFRYIGDASARSQEGLPVSRVDTSVYLMIKAAEDPGVGFNPIITLFAMIEPTRAVGEAGRGFFDLMESISKGSTRRFPSIEFITRSPGSPYLEYFEKLMNTWK